MEPFFFNQYQSLGPAFSAPAYPRSPSNPKLIAWNHDLASELGLGELSSEQATQWFSGQQLPEKATACAAAYAGHQFGRFVPVLGDGRALLIGELQTKSGEIFDIQLKGAGPTPFSRGGDGFAALGPVIREYLVSEFMNSIGVPTTRSLAACITGDMVFRDQIYPGAVLTRVASSHIRVGSFEYHRYREDRESLDALLRYCIERHYPQLRDSQRPAFEFFKCVSDRLASLVAEWMGLGFVHGVLNSDNTSVAGLTLDYGPCAFLDEYNPQKVFSSIDRQGRYRFSQQAPILQWNMARLAECLLPLESLANAPLDPAIANDYSEVLQQFVPLANQRIQNRLCRKLGFDLDSNSPSDAQARVLDLWLALLERYSLDYTRAWKALEQHLQQDEAAAKSFASDLPFASDDFKAFAELWKAQNPSLNLLAQNPSYIPRNHVIERVIENAQAGAFSLFNELLECLKNPTSQSERWHKFALAPLESEKVTQTFCGT